MEFIHRRGVVLQEGGAEDGPCAKRERRPAGGAGSAGSAGGAGAASSAARPAPAKDKEKDRRRILKRL